MHKIKKVFKILLVSSLSLMCIVQILLLNDNIKNKISVIYNLESQYVYSEQEIPKGTVKIEISNPSDNIYILQNGERIVSLDKKNYTVEVFDNSVIEIDGREYDDKFNVKIVSVSDNLYGYYEEKIEISQNIVILGRFFVK